MNLRTVIIGNFNCTSKRKRFYLKDRKIGCGVRTDRRLLKSFNDSANIAVSTITVNVIKSVVGRRKIKKKEKANACLCGQEAGVQRRKT